MRTAEGAMGTPGGGLCCGSVAAASGVGLEPEPAEIVLNARAVRQHTSVSEIGDAENISKSYVSRILRLALLAPDIVEVILDGRTDQAVNLEQLEQPMPVS
jgi:hypothetical protein